MFGLPTPQGMLIALAATPSARAPWTGGVLDELSKGLEERNTGCLPIVAFSASSSVPTSFPRPRPASSSAIA